MVSHHSSRNYMKTRIFKIAFHPEPVLQPSSEGTPITTIHHIGDI